LWRNGRLLEDIIEQYDLEVLNPQGVYPAVSGYRATRRCLKRGRKIPNIVTIHMLCYMKWWYYRLGCGMLNWSADHVITESDCERIRLQDHGMRRPTTVIYNCFPPEKFAAVRETRSEIRRRMQWPEDRVVFVMPARIGPEKGHDILFQALAREEVRRLPALFYLAGDGRLMEDRRVLARTLGVEDKVVFGGFRKDLPALYKAADVFLMCSRVESLPLSIREGMVAGLPVLSTNVGGIAEAVEDGASGILIPPGDSAALARTILTMASDTDLRARLGRRGHEISREKFDFDRWIARTIEVMSAVRREFIRLHGRSEQVRNA
jgi:glycosyltransferase involved in cell wall biosynthesis